MLAASPTVVVATRAAPGQAGLEFLGDDPCAKDVDWLVDVVSYGEQCDYTRKLHWRDTAGAAAGFDLLRGRVDAVRAAAKASRELPAVEVTRNDRWVVLHFTLQPEKIDDATLALFEALLR